jgi:glycosyltransferase involved in cell wall biosynthesis
LKVICIYPGMAKEKNDNAFMLLRLQERGVNLSIVASSSLGLKGKGRLASYENMDGISIYRLYWNLWEMLLFPTKHFHKILQLTKGLKPDLIFCCQEFNMRIALMLQKHFEVPIVLQVEDAGRIYSGEAYSFKFNSLLGVIGLPSGQKFWPWLCSKACKVITCHPRDQQILKELSQFGATIHYVPWPTSIPTDFEPPSSKSKYRGVYVGSLNPFKNTQEFELSIPRILDATPTKEFVIVGPGSHAKIAKDLQKRTNGSVRYIRELPRNEALQLIASSYFAYTPVKKGGWGFIGDCWTVGTPVIMTHNDYYVTNKMNALVANDINDLIHNINRLYNEPALYERLRKQGYRESEVRSAKIVGDAFYDVFSKAITPS